MSSGRQPRARSLFTGDLSHSRTMQVVLWSILREKKVNYGVLRVNDAEHKLEGEIGVLWGLHVIGASMNARPERGYEALKLLLAAHSGTFEYVDFGDESPLCLDNGLKIRLTDLISAWPNMPETLPSGKISLNRMRALTAKESGNYSEDAIIDQSVLERLRRFERDSMRLRVFAFWGAFVVLSSIAGLMGICR